MNWRKVLEITDDTVTVEQIESRFRRLAKHRHPDVGGSVEAMQELVQAKEEALEFAKLPKLGMVSIQDQYEYANAAYRQMNAQQSQWQQQAQASFYASIFGGSANLGAMGGGNWANKGGSYYCGVDVGKLEEVEDPPIPSRMEFLRSWIEKTARGED